MDSGCSKNFTDDFTKFLSLLLKIMLKERWLELIKRLNDLKKLNEYDQTQAGWHIYQKWLPGNGWSFFGLILRGYKL